jgi:hypothetical protein
MMSVLIAGYWWQPDEGSKFSAPYTADDVRKLQRMVAKHCTAPHQFGVITDRPELFAGDADIRAIPIDRATHVPSTCYVRLMTFHPDGKALFGADRLLQIDLDTLIVGNIDHLVTREENLVLWRNPARHPSRPGRSAYNTSILLHELGTIPEIWQTFVDFRTVGKRIPAKDDQWFLSDALGEDVPYFDGVRDGVYRIAREDTPNSGVWGELPANACIVTCPGSEGKADNPAVMAGNPWLAEYRA